VLTIGFEYDRAAADTSQYNTRVFIDNVSVVDGSPPAPVGLTLPNTTIVATETTILALPGVTDAFTLGGIEVDDAATLTINDAAVVSIPDGPVTVDGTLCVAGDLQVGGILSGSGTVLQGSSAVVVDGAVAPGGSIGTLTLNGGGDLDVNGSTEIEVSGSGSPPTAGTNNDLVHSAGDVDVTGSTLDLTWLPGAAGDGLFGGTYTVIDGFTMTGTPALGTFKNASTGTNIAAGYILAGPTNTGAAITVQLDNLIVGDANLDGDCDVIQLDGKGDAQILTSNLGATSGMGWEDGDFNFDGDVDVIQLDGKGDAQLLTSNLGASLDVGHDVGAGVAECLYNEFTGELLFDVGADVGIVGIGAATIYTASVEDFLGESPAQNDGTTLGYFKPSGLPVGADSVGICLDPGLTASDITFMYTPVGGDTVLDAPVTVIPEPATLAMLLGGLAGLVVPGRRRRT